MRVFISFVTIFFTVIGVWLAVGVFSRGDVGPELFIVAWGSIAVPWLLWFWFVMPWEIQVSDSGLRFVARLQQQEVPWSALCQVRSRVYDVNRQWLRWGWDDGALWTSSGFENLHELLSDVARRAPHVQIKSL
jgi:hypothetical protein